jgi:hypothetical protein
MTREEALAEARRKYVVEKGKSYWLIYNRDTGQYVGDGEDEAEFDTREDARRFRDRHCTARVKADADRRGEGA